MIIVVIYIFITLVLLFKNRVISFKSSTDEYFLLNLGIIIALFAVHMYEIHALSDTIFPFLDEKKAFYETPKSETFLEILNNIFSPYYLYHLIVKTALVSTPPIVLKFINVFILLIFMALIYKISNFDNRVFRFFPIFLPYLYFLSFMNMRDMLIITSTLAFIIEVSNFNNKKIFSIILLALIVWMLRPMYLVILTGSIGFILFYKGKPKYKIYSILLFFLIIFIFRDFIITQYGHFTHKIFKQKMETNIEMLNYGEQITAFSYVIAFFKMFLTPFPTSKLQQMLSPQLSDNFYLIEMSRIIMHAAFYYLIIFTICRWKEFIAWVKANKFNALLFLMAFANSIVYAFYRMGSGSSRNKLWPIILLFLFYIYARQNKIKPSIKFGNISI